MADWDEVYAAKKNESSTPAEVLINNVHLLAGQGEALDYACGLAGNGVLLESLGYEVSAWDYSSVAVQKINELAQSCGRDIRAECVDLENNPPNVSNCFDVIVVSYFLYRENLRSLYEFLKPGGLLFYQTYSGDQINGVGPSRADFRLQRGELLNIFSDMELLYYREDCLLSKASDSSKPDQVYFIAKK